MRLLLANNAVKMSYQASWACAKKLQKLSQRCKWRAHLPLLQQISPAPLWVQDKGFLQFAVCRNTHGFTAIFMHAGACYKVWLSSIEQRLMRTFSSLGKKPVCSCITLSAIRLKNSNWNYMFRKLLDFLS